jgi:hypothetical protein
MGDKSPLKTALVLVVGVFAFGVGKWAADVDSKNQFEEKRSRLLMQTAATARQQLKGKKVDDITSISDVLYEPPATLRYNYFVSNDAAADAVAGAQYEEQHQFLMGKYCQNMRSLVNAGITVLYVYYKSYMREAARFYLPPYECSKHPSN